MDGETNGSQEATQGAQDASQQQGQEQQETQQGQQEVTGGNSGTDYEKQIAERGEIAELKAQGESDRIDFRLQLAGACNVKAARPPLRSRQRRGQVERGRALALRGHG